MTSLPTETQVRAWLADSDLTELLGLLCRDLWTRRALRVLYALRCLDTSQTYEDQKADIAEARARITANEVRLRSLLECLEAAL